MAYRNLKEYLKEIDCCDQILKIDPENITALNNKGKAYGNLEEY